VTAEIQPSYDGSVCRRKDFRRFFMENQPLYADCVTRSEAFRERVRDLSSKGVFLDTRRKLAVGEEIAMTIPLSKSRATIKATGEIVRQEPDGVGIEFRVTFNY
jgi:hypothetical protein